MTSRTDQRDARDRRAEKRPFGGSRFTQRMDSVSTAHKVLIVIGLIALISLGDIATGLEFPFLVFYFVPIAFAGRYLGAVAGNWTAVGCVIFWTFAEFHTGITHPVWTTVLWNLSTTIVSFLLVSAGAARVRRDVDYFRQLAHHDSLTGLLNSRGFRERAEIEIERCRRLEKPLTVACLDLDNFKQVNDTHGHAAGDEMLRTIGQAIEAITRRTELAARIGGDEFAMLFPEMDEDGAQVVAERFRAAIMSVSDASHAGVTPSIGIAVFHNIPAGGLDVMVRMADAAMYEAKQSGKNAIRARVAHPEHETLAAFAEV
ncbi:MAG: GGDEF domain-containing protein [Candidatus Sumerlaeaceae bacterium]|nr:GGDEF domain-containing protein [Candidatus Sumerlaeaceae bacterium]